MIFPETFENKIGFDCLRRLVIESCSGPLSVEEAKGMQFCKERGEVVRMLRETAEMLEILNNSLNLNLTDVSEARNAIAELRTEGSYVQPKSLFALLKMLMSSDEVRSFFVKQSAEGRFPNLKKISESLYTFPELISAINSTINKYGEVKDTASDRLYEIRSNMRSAQGSMSRAMKRVLDRASAEGIIDKDTNASMRDGRLVIPVEASKKRSITGIVHDASATGKTVFIEPLEVVEASNRLRELEMEERREVIEILRNLATKLRPHADDVEGACRILAKFDFIRAKALVARDVDGRMPVIDKNVVIEWYHAVHPQLLLALRKAGKEVVPLNLTLNQKDRILIISGPNAGGKSVCLKTAGVVQYMMQCGMLPTVYENSHMGIFDNIFVDIGDEQSMESDLSTYSSHLKNMKFFLRNCTARTLILADEMGSGTEPQIGGALAQAILEKLSKTKCFGIITTHYQNLKTFAGEHEGFINGAMLYDRQHLQPAFQLSIGNPGSSFAVEIARKIGLDNDVIEEAKEIVGSDYVNLDKYLLDIARDRRYWQNKRQNIKEKESRLDSLLSLYEDKADDLKSQRNTILHEAKAEAKEILATANAKIEKAIREIKEAQAEKEATRKIRTEFEAFKKSVATEEQDANLEPEPLKRLKHQSKRSKEQLVKRRDKSHSTDTTRELAVGDYVMMKDGNVPGQIIRIEGKKAEVAFGALRTTVQVVNLVPSKAPKESALSQKSGISVATSSAARERQLNFKPEIDIRGMRGDEAVQAIIYFLDDAIQFNAKRLRILHGTGTGILKTLIRQQLNVNPSVKSFRDEDVRFGGAGITVVDLE